jgi:twitching motility protein PilI
MAKQSSIREYQQNILSRLENAKKVGAEAPAGFLGVVIGTKNVLINLQEISETLPITDIQPVPLVKPWFLGVANVRGVLYTINDMAQIIENNLTQLTSSARLLLISDSIAANVAFLADRLIGLRKLEELTPHTELAEDSICLKKQTYQDDQNRLWHMLDCDLFVRSKEFATPYDI